MPNNKSQKNNIYIYYCRVNGTKLNVKAEVIILGKEKASNLHSSK